MVLCITVLHHYKNKLHKLIITEWDKTIHAMNKQKVLAYRNFITVLQILYKKNGQARLFSVKTQRKNHLTQKKQVVWLITYLVGPVQIWTLIINFFSKARDHFRWRPQHILQEDKENSWYIICNAFPRQCNFALPLERENNRKGYLILHAQVRLIQICNHSRHLRVIHQNSIISKQLMDGIASSTISYPKTMKFWNQNNRIQPHNLDPWSV